MTQVRPPQTAFSSGEIDPLLHAREDFQRHQTGLAECRGFVPLRQGGVTRAPGTIYRGTTRNSAPAVRLPFVFAANDAAELEFTPGKMRIWRYGQLVMSGGAPVEIDTPFLEADLPNLRAAQDADVLFLLDGRNPIQQLSRFSLTSWTLAPAALEAGPFRPQNVDEDKTIRCAVQPTDDIVAWAENEALTIGEIRKAGLNIYQYLGTGQPGALADGTAGPTVPSHLSGVQGYAVESVTPPATPDQAFWEFVSTADNIAGQTVYLQGTGNIFTADHVGALVRLEPYDWLRIPIWVGNSEMPGGSLLRFDDNIYQIGYLNGSGVPTFVGEKPETGVNPPTHSAGSVRTDASKNVIYKHVSKDFGIVRITGVTNANLATAIVVEPVPQPLFDDPSYRWSIGAWNGLYGHPGLIAWHEQRLFISGLESDPRVLSASEQGAYRSFLPGSDAPSSFSYDIGGGGSRNAIRWLVSSGESIFVGTMGELRRGHGGSNGEPITPTTFRMDLISSIGCSAAPPVVPFGWPVYITRDRSRVFEARYNFTNDNFSPLELSLPSAHLGAARFAQIVWQSSPTPTGWLRRDDGSVALLIYEPDQDVLGWAVLTVGGGFVEDVCVSPSADDAADVVTLVVRRTLNGETVRCVEEVSSNHLLPVVERNHAFCALALQAAPASDTFSVPHLAGQQVAAWTDAGGFTGLTVAADGTVTLPLPATRAIIGLMDDTHRLRTLPLRAPARDGDSRGRKRKLVKGGGVLLRDTAGGRLRPLSRNRAEDWHVGGSYRLIELPALALRPAGRSGTVSTDASTEYADDVAIQIEPEGLAPLTIAGLVPAIDEAGA